MAAHGGGSLMQTSPRTRSIPLRTEQIILFRISGQLFGVSSAAIQEVRSSDSLSGSSSEIFADGLNKVRQITKRGDATVYVVDGARHFGLQSTSGALVFVLRNTRTALLVDSIEKMTTMTRLQALPKAFRREERSWYRGVTALDQTVVPIVHPDGFLTPQELSELDASIAEKEFHFADSVEGTNSRQ
jgi:chemotaxis signal transduction protein